MTMQEIKELLDLFNASGVGELELQRGEDRIRIRKAGDAAEMVARRAPAPSADASAEAAPQPAAGPEPPKEESGLVPVKSPIVGTYYDSPSPGAEPFVKVGDSVEPGQVLCIIESMKLMNEIEAEVAGVIAAKLVENGRPVEYGEALFAILPR
jgi:acetyl-CoA carboxylase biotin carboxyl carrier protein